MEVVATATRTWSSESTTQTLHDAHSVEFELLSELGLPGFALLVTAVVAAFAGALRV